MRRTSTTMTRKMMMRTGRWRTLIRYVVVLSVGSVRHAYVVYRMQLRARRRMTRRRRKRRKVAMRRRSLCRHAMGNG